MKPRLIVADEPVSALDVSIQAQILNLLAELQQRHGLTYLFISHDLGVISQISNRVAVMYVGRLLEMASREVLAAGRLHPYTEALLAAVPRPTPERTFNPPALKGEPPSPVNVPSGCPFHPRCPEAQLPLCRESVPPLRKPPRTTGWPAISGDRMAGLNVLGKISGSRYSGWRPTVDGSPFPAL